MEETKYLTGSQPGEVLLRWAKALPMLGQLLFRLSRDPRVPRRNKLVLLGVALYILLPYDVIPDWIPGVGRLDDLALTILALDGILNQVPDEVIDEHWDGDLETLETIRGALAHASEFVPKDVRRRLLGSE